MVGARTRGLQEGRGGEKREERENGNRGDRKRNKEYDGERVERG